MLYEDFKRQNDSSKKFFSHLGKLEDVNLSDNTCTLVFLDNITRNLSIQDIVNDIIYNGMGAVSNPSALRGWKGFDK